MTIPNEDGWWLFHEDGEHGPQLILVINGFVADDDEWERAAGRPPDNDWCENYWEGNSVESMTNGPLTTGKWSKYVDTKETRGMEQVQPTGSRAGESRSGGSREETGREEKGESQEA